MFSEYLNHCTRSHPSVTYFPAIPLMESYNDFPPLGSPLGSSPEEGTSTQRVQINRVSFARRAINSSLMQLPHAVSTQTRRSDRGPIRVYFNEVTYSDTLLQGLRPEIESSLELLSDADRSNLSHEDLCTVCLCRLDGAPEETESEETDVPPPAAPRPLKRIKGCKHIFCESCINRWLMRSHFCPVCKYVIAQPVESSGYPPINPSQISTRPDRQGYAIATLIGVRNRIEVEEHDSDDEDDEW